MTKNPKSETRKKTKTTNWKMNKGKKRKRKELTTSTPTLRIIHNTEFQEIKIIKNFGEGYKISKIENCQTEAKSINTP